MDEEAILFIRKHQEEIQTLKDWLKVYQFGFYIATTGWIATVVGFIMLMQGGW